MRKELLNFIAYAKKKGYADPNSIWKKTKGGGKTLTIKKGDFSYLDTYFGSQIDGGQERILYNGKVIWVMSYRGGVCKGKEKLGGEAFVFLKKCISKIPKNFPARGPKKFKQGKWLYENKWVGNIENFVGEEDIYFDGEKICFRNYLGGLVKNKK